MINFMETSEESEEEFYDTETVAPAPHQLMMLSSVAINTSLTSPRTMQLQVQIQGHDFLFLVDSGSSACFIDQSKAQLLTGSKPLDTPVLVQVAGGALLLSTEYSPQMQWSAEGAIFSDTFRVLSLASYDGIIGLDWLGKYNPMITHWEQGWLAIQHEGRQVVLHGEGPNLCTHALVEIHHIRDSVPEKQELLPTEVQTVLDSFSVVFEAPTGLPPRRRYDHHIPLIPGARPVSVRPYHVAPELKTEIEKQIQELLEQGVITHNNSAFGSPVMLVKNGDKTWRLVVDYRHLNALTVKGKYPLPVIDELLDELS